MKHPCSCMPPAANPQVVEQNGMWLCEYDGKTYPTMVRRYIPLIKCTDCTSECTLNLFNDTVCPGPPNRSPHLAYNATGRLQAVTFMLKHCWNVEGVLAQRLHFCTWQN